MLLEPGGFAIPICPIAPAGGLKRGCGSVTGLKWGCSSVAGMWRGQYAVPAARWTVSCLSATVSSPEKFLTEFLAGIGPHIRSRHQYLPQTAADGWRRALIGCAVNLSTYSVQYLPTHH